MTQPTVVSALPVAKGSEGRFVGIHAIQSFADTNLNRDKNGSPKSLHYGGYPRTRVSSQAWSRQIRQNIRQNIQGSAISSRRIPEYIAEILTAKYAVDASRAITLGAAAVGGLGKKGIKIAADGTFRSQAMITIPHDAAEALARVALDNQEALLDAADKFLKEVAKNASKSAENPDETEVSNPTSIPVPKDVGAQLNGAFFSAGSLDLALMGRFLAEMDGADVPTAVTIADAFTTTPRVVIDDYFTVVDDVLNKRGIHMAANQGVQPFSPGVFYRHGFVDTDQIRINLRAMNTPEEKIEGLVDEAVNLFIKAFVNAVPVSKSSRSGNNVLPSSIVVTVGDEVPTSGAPAFEQPIHGSEGTSPESLRRLVEYLKSAWILRPATRAEILPIESQSKALASELV